jgi:hypothetical protein
MTLLKTLVDWRGRHEDSCGSTGLGRPHRRFSEATEKVVIYADECLYLNVPLLFCFIIMVLKYLGGI